MAAAAAVTTGGARTAASSTHPESGDVRLYYGAADSSICLATARLPDTINAVLAVPRET